MSDRRPLVIADSCIGGLSVLKSIEDVGGAMDVEFLDPGAYCRGLLDCDSFSQNGGTDLTVTGEVVSVQIVEQFAERYLQQFG